MKRIILFLLVFPIIAFGQYPQHRSDSYVNDFANVIPDDKEYIIDNKIRDFKEKSSIEITVVTVKGLNGNSIEEYTTGLFRTWGVGKKGLDNGLMILLSPSDRKWRIEVGYGLEPWITDGEAKIQGNRILKPNFKKKDFFAGFDGIVDAMIIKLGTNSWTNRVEAKAARDKILAEQATAAAQMKAEYEKKQAAEQEERMAAAGEFFKYFFLIAAFIGFVVFIVYRRYKEKKKEEEADRNRKRIIAELKQRNIDFINTYNNALQKMMLHENKSLIGDQINIMTGILASLKNYPFKNSDELNRHAVPSTSDITAENFDSIKEALEKTHTEMRALAASSLKEAEEINDVLSQLKSVFEFMTSINQTFSSILAKGKRADEKNKNTLYPKSDWNFDTVSVCVKKSVQLLEKMKNESAAKNENIQSLSKLLKTLKTDKGSIMTQVNFAENYIKGLYDHIEYMEKAAGFIAKNQNRIGSLVAEAQRKVEQRDVSSSTIRSFENTKTKAKSFVMPTDIISGYNALSGIIGELEGIIRKADSDVYDAKRKREQEEEEERRRIRRAEEAAEEARRASIYSSSSSSSDWGSSSSSSSSSSSDFGGGSSGGGGASGDY